jgi:hypothetical protein
VGVLLALGLTALGGEEPAQEKDPAEAVVTTFMTAFKDKQLDPLMATVAVPWFHNGKTILRDQPAVRQAFETLFAKQKDTSKIVFAIKKVVPYETIRDAMNDEERGQLDQVMGASDRAVLLVMANPARQKPPETVVVLVRVKDGQGKVVGIKN